MCANIIVGVVILLISFGQMDVGVKTALAVIAVLWIIAPVIMYKISKKAESEEKKLSQEDKNFLLDTAYKTWLYFKENLNEKNNFLPPDNYQGDRKPNFIDRTSSTNIGLALLSVIASCDLKFETLEDGIEAFIKLLSTGYYKKGLTTPELMEKKYAGGSNTWAAKVNNYINQVKEA